MKRLQLYAGLVLIVAWISANVTDYDNPLPALAVGFLGGLFKKIGGAVKSIGKIGLKAVSIIPGVSTIVAGAGSAVSALLGGGTVVAEQPGVGQTVISRAPRGQLAKAGFVDQMMAFKIAGMPVIPIAVGSAALWFILSRVKGK